MAGNCALAEPRESLRISKTMVESSGRPRTVLGAMPSGKPPLERLAVLRIREGTLYPILARLEDEGFVVGQRKPSSGGPPRKYFRLTDAGRRHVAAINEHWDEVVAALRESQAPAGRGEQQ